MLVAAVAAERTPSLADGSRLVKPCSALIPKQSGLATCASIGILEGSKRRARNGLKKPKDVDRPVLAH
jgi:hypothetical protein